MNKLITMILLTISLNGISQDTRFPFFENVDVTLKEEVVKIDTTEIYLYRIQIENSSDSTYIFWFSEINKIDLTTNELIQDHFFKTKGDFNLFQLATETISQDTKLPLNSFSFFTIVIDQHSKFQYNIIVKDQKINEIRESIFRLINNQIVLIPETKINEIINIKTIDRILYKSNSTMIDWKILSSKILN